MLKLQKCMLTGPTLCIVQHSNNLAAIEKLSIPVAYFILMCFARFPLCPKMSQFGHKLIFPGKGDDNDEDSDEDNVE